MLGTGFEKWEPLELILDTKRALQDWADDHFSRDDPSDFPPELMWRVRCMNLIFRIDRLIVQLRMWKMETKRAYAFARWLKEYRSDEDQTRVLANEFGELLGEAFHEAEAQWRLAGNSIIPRWAKKKSDDKSRANIEKSGISNEIQPLDEVAIAILHYLSGQKALRKQIDISEGVKLEPEGTRGLDVKTIRPRLKNLIDLGFITQPGGSRKGYQITTLGRNRLDPFASQVKLPESRI